MKYSTALRQSKQSVKFLLIAAPAMWGFFIWFHAWPLAAIATLMTLFLLMDAWNIIKIKREVEKAPDCLKQKIPGT